MASYDDDKAVYKKLKVLLEEALAEDKQLREKFKMGDRLDIVPRELHAILDEVEDNLTKIAAIQARQKKREDVLGEDEVVVYVYLFNGSGKEAVSWSSMLTKDALFGYSVNRPIYGKPEHIDNLLESRMPPENHAGLALIVKKQDVIEQQESAFATDPLKQPLIRVREGVFKQENIVYFQHERKRYSVGEKGKLTLKAK